MKGPGVAGGLNAGFVSVPRPARPRRWPCLVPRALLAPGFVGQTPAAAFGRSSACLPRDWAVIPPGFPWARSHAVTPPPHVTLGSVSEGMLHEKLRREGLAGCEEVL